MFVFKRWQEEKTHFFGDMLNTLAKVDKGFHRSRTYNWYSCLSVEVASSRRFRTIRLVKDGSKPEVLRVP